MNKTLSTTLILFIAFIFIFASFGFVLAGCYCTCNSGTNTDIGAVNNADICRQSCSPAMYSCPELLEEVQVEAERYDLKDSTKQSSKLDNPLGTESIPSIIGKIIKTFLGIIGTISLVMFIYGGLLMLTSAGKSGQIQKGQQTLVWASLGILVVFASYAILRFVFSAFGL